MSRSAIGSLFCANADEAASVAISASTMRMEVLLSINEPFRDQPLLNHLGDLGVILVLHHHVRVALDADLREIDPVDPAACRLDGIGIFGVDLLERGPARMLVNVVAEHH